MRRSSCRDALTRWKDEAAELIEEKAIEAVWDSPTYIRLGFMAIRAAVGQALRTLRGRGNAYAAKPVALGHRMQSIPWRGGYEPTAITLRHNDLVESDKSWKDKTISFCSVHNANAADTVWVRLAMLHIQVTPRDIKVEAQVNPGQNLEVWNWRTLDNGWVQVPLGELQAAHVVQTLLEVALLNLPHLKAKCVPDTWHGTEDFKIPLPSMWYESELFLQYKPPGPHLLDLATPGIVPGRSLAMRSAEIETTGEGFTNRRLRLLLNHPPKTNSKRPVHMATEAPWIQKIVRSPYGKCGCQKGPEVCARGRYLYDCETGKVVLGTGSEPYVAMSYVWSESSWRTMRRVVALLAEATHCRYFWIDQLCIDQQCTEHKREQVPQMGCVYQQAQLVACMVPGVTARLPDEVRDPAMVMARASYLRKTLLFKHQLKKQPWSQRVWTWQEGLLGTSTVYVTANDIVQGWVADNVLCAKKLNPEKLLEKPDLVTNISGLPEGACAISLNLAVRANHTVMKRRWTSCQERREEMEQWGISTDCCLTEALKATRNRGATEKVDEIYAVLGMVRGGSGLRAQYGISREDALQNALEAGLLTADLLAGLRDCNVHSKVDNRREAGRTWMPKLHEFLSVGQELGFSSGMKNFMSSHSAGGARVKLRCLPLLSVHPEDWDDGLGGTHKRWILRDKDGIMMAKVPAVGAETGTAQRPVKLAVLGDDGAVVLVPDVSGYHFRLISGVWYILTDVGESCLLEEEVVIV